jgi:hypothetical protein
MGECRNSRWNFLRQLKIPIYKALFLLIEYV